MFSNKFLGIGLILISLISSMKSEYVPNGNLFYCIY